MYFKILGYDVFRITMNHGTNYFSISGLHCIFTLPSYMYVYHNSVSLNVLRPTCIEVTNTPRIKHLHLSKQWSQDNWANNLGRVVTESTNEHTYIESTKHKVNNIVISLHSRTVVFKTQVLALHQAIGFLLGCHFSYTDN